MRDLSQYTDAELEAIAGGVKADISQMSDEELEAIANQKQPTPRDNSTWGRVKRAAMLPVAIGKGVKRGALDVGEGLKQLYLEATDSDKAKEYTKQVDAEREAYRRDPVIQDFADTSEYFRTLVNTAPFAAPIGRGLEALTVGAKAAPGLLKNILMGAGEGAAIGGAQYVPEGGSRGFNTTVGGLLGGAIPGALGTGAVGYNWLTNRTAKNVLKGADEEIAKSNLEAARRLDKDMSLTPAEASGNPLTAGVQGKTGTSAKGAELMQEFGEKRLTTEKRIVNNFLNDVSPTNKNASADIRSIAKESITKEQKQLDKISKPLYDKAYQEIIPDDKLKTLMDDGIVNKAYSTIDKSPLYSNELKNAAPNTIKRLDLVKRQIDDQIGTAKKAGERNAVRLLQESKKKLVSVLDEVSPDYASARAIYGEGAKPLEALKNSNLGKIANLKDTQLKQVAKTIFDPTQTDIKVLNQLQREITKQSPEAWNRIVRNHMENKLASVEGDVSGSKFYKKLLAKDRDFNQLMAAVKDIPGAAQKLNDMRAAFKNLINPLTAKGAAGMSRTSMMDKRNMLDAVKAEASNLIGGKYDEAAVKLITSNKWDKEFKAISKIKDKQLKVQRLSDLLGRISALEATQNDKSLEE